jgi:hypothetical protein
MNDSIRIDAGIKRILINDGPDFIEFNPEDVLFVEKFYKVIGDFQAKLKEYQERAKEIDFSASKTQDELPDNLDEQLEFIKDVCKFTHERIDYLFGEGTSEKLFHGAESLSMIEQFFEGLIPFIKQKREQRLAKYLIGHNEPAARPTAKNSRNKRARVAHKP